MNNETQRSDYTETDRLLAWWLISRDVARGAKADTALAAHYRERARQDRAFAALHPGSYTQDEMQIAGRSHDCAAELIETRMRVSERKSA